MAEVKHSLRVLDDSDHDDEISSLIIAARRWCETYTGRALITQTWDWTTDQLCNLQELPKPPLQSVTSITYVDTNGASQTHSSTLYTVDIAHQPGRIFPNYGQSWPSTRDIWNAITVRIVVGYGAAPSAVPEELRRAMILHVRDAFEACGGTEMRAAQSMAFPYKVHDLPS